MNHPSFLRPRTSLPQSTENSLMNATSRSLAFLFFACSLVAGAAEPPVVGPAARLSVTPSGEIEIAMADGAVARFVAT
jgi:hypothetical protein